MAAHGRHEAKVERNSVEHQMMESFKLYAMQQSTQFQQAAQAEHLQMAGAARAEVEASRRELILAQTRFQETSSEQSVQIGSLQGVLSHAEARDRAVREDLQRLRSESERYSQLFGRAEQHWQLLQTEHHTSDQLVKMQRSELHNALLERTANQSATSELCGQFAALEHAQASSAAECRMLTAQLRTETRHAPTADVGSAWDQRDEHFQALTHRFDEFKLVVEQTLTDVQCCVRSFQDQVSALETGV